MTLAPKDALRPPSPLGVSRGASAGVRRSFGEGGRAFLRGPPSPSASAWAAVARSAKAPRFATNGAAYSRRAVCCIPRGFPLSVIAVIACPACGWTDAPARTPAVPFSGIASTWTGAGTADILSAPRLYREHEYGTRVAQKCRPSSSTRGAGNPTPSGCTPFHHLCDPRDLRADVICVIRVICGLISSA